MLDFEKLTINGQVIDFALISSDREITTGEKGKLLILQAMDVDTSHNQSSELSRLSAQISEFAIMYPSLLTHGAYELLNVNQETYQKVKDFSFRVFTVN